MSSPAPSLSDAEDLPRQYVQFCGMLMETVNKAKVAIEEAGFNADQRHGIFTEMYLRIVIGAGDILRRVTPREGHLTPGPISQVTPLGLLFLFLLSNRAHHLFLFLFLKFYRRLWIYRQVAFVFPLLLLLSRCRPRAPWKGPQLLLGPLPPTPALPVDEPSQIRAPTTTTSRPIIRIDMPVPGTTVPS